MAKGYWVTLYRSVSNPAALAAYAKLAGPAIEAGGGRFVTRGMPARAFEAGSNQRTVVIEFESVEQAIAGKLWRSRVTAVLLAAFAAIALGLAAVGIYGVISYGVRDRTREIGIRVALGGTRADVLRLVMIASLKPVTVGIALGICAAIAASRFVTALLYQVTATDFSTYLWVVVTLICTAVLATGVPAWRATQADPVTALHHE